MTHRERWIFAAVAIFIFYILTLLCSCNDAKRIQRIEKRHPSWSHTDTIFHNDTTIISSIHQDTTLISHNKIDTFTITKDRLKIQIVKKYDTLKVNSVVGGDTIIKTIPQYITTVQPPKPIGWLQRFAMWIGYIILILLGLAIILKVLKAYGKLPFKIPF